MYLEIVCAICLTVWETKSLILKMSDNSAIMHQVYILLYIILKIRVVFFSMKNFVKMILGKISWKWFHEKFHENDFTKISWKCIWFHEKFHILNIIWRSMKIVHESRTVWLIKAISKMFPKVSELVRGQEKIQLG